jgi:hypothetical protein
MRSPEHTSSISHSCRVYYCSDTLSACEITYPCADVASIDHFDLAESLEREAHIGLTGVVGHTIDVDSVGHCDKVALSNSGTASTKSESHWHLSLLWLV